jgi:hypothetical protein
MPLAIGLVALSVLADMLYVTAAFALIAIEKNDNISNTNDMLSD